MDEEHLSAGLIRLSPDDEPVGAPILRHARARRRCARRGAAIAIATSLALVLGAAVPSVARAQVDEEHVTDRATRQPDPRWPVIARARDPRRHRPHQQRVQERGRGAPGVTALFGALVVLAGVSELTGWMRRVRWGHRSAWAAGALSGTLGGVVGNQGGIRTAALLGFDVPKESFVATATAIGLLVDGARLPVYLATQWHDILRVCPLVLTATIAVVVGTALGTRVLGHLRQTTFRRVIGALLILLGLYMAVAGRG